MSTPCRPAIPPTPIPLIQSPGAADLSGTATFDTILIRSLAVTSRIGATAEERAFPQRLLLDLEIVPSLPFGRMQDDLASTVDYAAVSRELQSVCAEKERKLLETLAVDCVDHILQRHPAHQVMVRIRKFVLPETEFVAVEHRGCRNAPPPA